MIGRPHPENPCSRPIAATRTPEIRRAVNKIALTPRAELRMNVA